MKAMDLLSPNPTIKAALDALASLTAERRQRDLHLARMVSAEMHDTAKAIATRHDVSADAVLADLLDAPSRSEEHTSELQSLMRISYAVLCLKNKTTKHSHIISIHSH